MIFAFTAALAFSAGVLAQQAAPIVTNNNLTDQYQATLTAGPGSIAGTFEIQAATDGNGVLVAVSTNNFNLTDSREYTYHIHQYPVPANGSCNATGGHFDPYGVGDDHVCDPNAPQTCQLGDLSGKHGAITFGPEVTFAQLATQYPDSYLSTTQGNIVFFGNLSIVVHRKSDKFRLNCGNFEPANPAMASSTTTSAPMYANSTSTAVSTVMGNSSMTNSAAISTSTAIVPGTATANATVTPTVGGGANNGGNGAGPAITGTGGAAGMGVSLMFVVVSIALALSM